MLRQSAALAIGVLVVGASVATPPVVSAQPAPPGPVPGDPVPPPPDNGVVASAAPGTVITPDGWTITVVASDESQLPVAPLTTATSSREYLVGGTFAGAVTGNGITELTGGTLDVGYQIGCGAELKQMRLLGQAGIGTSGSSIGSPVPGGLSAPISGKVEIHPRPGTVTQVSVDKKTFKEAPVRVTLKDIHIKVDGCIGQSFIRSYATLTSTTADTSDVVAYYGVTKAV
ncbi:MspA family porin [Mycobacterium sp. Y57]|uniref:MspA family porin n=1 Tax=Mycolicibacterium xanthum TaxID=2796469 RepID=UPI001C850AE4|nr:MspA family porin [Mycolicibacterium xanthum]MBX7433876.1 MspA family porin [Mycolicibacterium xanthum]